MNAIDEVPASDTSVQDTPVLPASGERHVLVKILRYEFSDIVRGKGIIGYALFYLLITEMLIRFSGGAKALLSLSNVVLTVTPLVCILFGAIYLYNARNFVEMLLTQPVNRTQMFWGLYLGLAVPLAAAFGLGVGLPFGWHSEALAGYRAPFFMLLLCGVLLSLVFVALAFLVATMQDDKARGLSGAFLLWFFASVLYDGIMLLFIQGFARYPLEIPTLVMVMLNPIDLARILLMLNFDIAAMMGYTGAVFEAFFGSRGGLVLALATLLTWCALPVLGAYRNFVKKDF